MPPITYAKTGFLRSIPSFLLIDGISMRNGEGEKPRKQKNLERNRNRNRERERERSLAGKRGSMRLTPVNVTCVESRIVIHHV